MATILLIGSDPSLIEGLAQTLAAVGHRVIHGANIADLLVREDAEAPLIAVVERAIAASGVELLRLPLERGGTIVLYRTVADAAPALPPSVQRLVIADLVLPLERQRLVALVQSVEDRRRSRQVIDPTAAPQIVATRDPGSRTSGEGRA